MKQIIILIILITIILRSTYLYKQYIQKRKIDVLKTRNYIYTHFKDLFVYLPSKNLMIYDLSNDTNIECWINYCSRMKRLDEK